MIDRPTIVAAALTIGLLLGNRVDVTAKSTATPTTLQCGGAAMAIPAPGASATPTVPPSAADESAPLQPLVDIPLPGSASRFDYQSLDATSGLLYIAHMGANQLIVFDTRAQQVVGVVAGIDTPTGILAVPALDRIFVAAAGSHNVAVIAAGSLDVVARVGQIGFPDGLAYAPPVNQIFVSDESGGGELVIDGEANEVVTTIDIGGEAGNTHYDPVSGCVLVAVQSRNQLAAIDPATDRLVARYDLDAGCESPHGFLIDAPRRAAYVTCEDNATLLVVDLNTMQISETYPVGADPDVLAFDPGWQRLYVASEAGVVSVFAARGGQLRPIGEYTAPHAHSIAVDPATHHVYLPLEDVNGKPVLRILGAISPQDEE
jgi:DNA-binding beta-propeller fold protein YncE